MLFLFLTFISTTIEQDNNSGPPVSTGWGGCYGAVVGMSIVIRPPPVWDISDKHQDNYSPQLPGTGRGRQDVRKLRAGR